MCPRLRSPRIWQSGCSKYDLTDRTSSLDAVPMITTVQSNVNFNLSTHTLGFLSAQSLLVETLWGFLLTAVKVLATGLSSDDVGGFSWLDGPGMMLIMFDSKFVSALKHPKWIRRHMKVHAVSIAASRGADSRGCSRRRSRNTSWLWSWGETNTSDLPA